MYNSTIDKQMVDEMKTRGMLWQDFMEGKISRQEYDRLVDESVKAMMKRNIELFKRMAAK